VLDRAELLRPELPVVERQRQVGQEVDHQQQDRAERGRLDEEGDRVHRAGAAAYQVTERPDGDAKSVRLGVVMVEVCPDDFVGAERFGRCQRRKQRRPF
jgi:hypothetical protein